MFLGAEGVTRRRERDARVHVGRDAAAAASERQEVAFVSRHDRHQGAAPQLGLHELEILPTEGADAVRQFVGRAWPGRLGHGGQ